MQQPHKQCLSCSLPCGSLRPWVPAVVAAVVGRTNVAGAPPHWRSPASPLPTPPPLPAPATAVFDGHGGFAAAEYMQQNLYRIFTRVLDQRDGKADLQAPVDCPTHLNPVLTESFKHADEDLLAWMDGELAAGMQTPQAARTGRTAAS